jgi:predicted ATP-grasp superfamily ATP-dependent carboligase
MPEYDVTVTVRIETPDARTALNLIEDAVNKLAETVYLQDSSVQTTDGSDAPTEGE